ncbi:hypothetical protein MSG28_010151 [Choristoneura fumiferana]|uniref:Uncharacterized protein n=1 Tax=Choristoneura fumiferana TaxID=7141 RepID=A0ACC0KJP6_CHOFU|nr:hypothetical protein MSG28_010151 [Choristoneura fumiferana]
MQTEEEDRRNERERRNAEAPRMEKQSTALFRITTFSLSSIRLAQSVKTDWDRSSRVPMEGAISKTFQRMGTMNERMGGRGRKEGLKCEELQYYNLSEIF